MIEAMSGRSSGDDVVRLVVLPVGRDVFGKKATMTRNVRIVVRMALRMAEV